MALTDTSTQQSKCVLLFLKHTTPPYIRASLTVLREVSRYIGAPCLFPRIHGSVLFLYNLETGQRSRASLEFRFNSAFVYCLYGERALFCAHAYFDVLSLDLNSFHIAHLAKMKIRRVAPGIVHYRDFIYLFGGNPQHPLTSGERFNVAENRWDRLPDMRFPRAAFTPLVFRGEIYICCPDGEPFEAFDPVRCTFRLLPVCVGGGWLGTVVVALGEAVGLLTSSGELVRWEVDRGEVRRSGFWSTENLWSNIAPVRVGKYVFWTGGGTLIRFDSETYEVEKCEEEQTHG